MTNFELYFRSNSAKVRKEYLAPFAICFFDGNNSSMEVPKVYQSKPERFKFYSTHIFLVKRLGFIFVTINKDVNALLISVTLLTSKMT